MILFDDMPQCSHTAGRKTRLSVFEVRSRESTVISRSWGVFRGHRKPGDAVNASCVT